MRTSNIVSLFLLVTSLSWLASPQSHNVKLEANRLRKADSRIVLPGSSDSRPDEISIQSYHSEAYAYTNKKAFGGVGGGIKEEIPDKYRARYQSWKSEFLSTETGRKQWLSYAQNTRVTLTINISKENQHGATTGKYRWNDSGELVGVTIALGSEIDEGYPSPVYYPVMNSLAWGGASYLISPNVLAATKIAHEFGHVNQAATVDGRLYQLQNQLMPLYRTILLSNGHDTGDPRLIKLARQMGGTSVEVWEDREYWGEANAMLYLRDRISEKGARCVLFARIKRSVEEYAEGYAERFKQIAQSNPSPCSWQ